MTISFLKMALLELMKELDKVEITPILAGGYGLYLKQELLLEQGTRTLLQKLPEPRSTQDLDLLLQMSLMVDYEQFVSLRDVLLRLGYQATERNAYWQWEKNIPFMDGGYDVIVDLLTGDPAGWERLLKLEGGTASRRVRPINPNNKKDSPKFHARKTLEALAFEENNIPIPINGSLDGEDYQTEILVASPLTYTCMKLYALRDRIHSDTSDFGRHHAFDLYRIVGMMSEEDYESTKKRFSDLAEHEVVEECLRIVGDLFSNADSLGVLRIREHSEHEEDLQLQEFLEGLQDLFPKEKP
ncbi:MAG: hypothetical protein H6728_16380 [Myxococcales bacterium]|nr:hypothetical protein [Myxococcales bacterium]